MAQQSRRIRKLEPILLNWNWGPVHCLQMIKLHQIKNWTFPSLYRGTTDLLATFCQNSVSAFFYINLRNATKLLQTLRVGWLHKWEETDEISEQDGQSQRNKYQPKQQRLLWDRLYLVLINFESRNIGNLKDWVPWLWNNHSTQEPNPEKNLSFFLHSVEPHQEN